MGYEIDATKMYKTNEKIYNDGFFNGYDIAINDLMTALIYIQKMSKTECFKLFGLEHGENIIDKFNGKDIIKKVLEYKDNKNEIHIGDEICVGNDNFIITNITDVQWSGFDMQGKVAWGDVVNAKKTDRHFDNIKELLDFLKLIPHIPNDTDYCDACKYINLAENQLPCSKCCYNDCDSNMSYYEKEIIDDNDIDRDN